MAEWVEAVNRPAHQVRLDRAAALLAAHGVSGRWAALGPALVPRTVGILDDMALSCPEPTFAGLHGLLFGVMGFRGDREHYHAPRNSYLPMVLEKRTGIPITLAVVLMEVGRRLGVTIKGIGMPGHFLAAHDDASGRCWIDAFDGGRVLDLDGVEKLHASMFAGAQSFVPEVVLPEVDAHSILVRMLGNLRTTATFSRDVSAVADLVWMRQYLPGLTVEERREHIRLSTTVGRFTVAEAAVDDLAAVLGDDAPEVAEERLRRGAMLS